MNAEQRALRFNCNGSGLVGIVEVPERPLPRTGQRAAPLSKNGASPGKRLVKVACVRRERLERMAASLVTRQIDYSNAFLNISDHS